jgi:glycosyltransferase involved in cell wall biosynthesis
MSENYWLNSAPDAPSDFDNLIKENNPATEARQVLRHRALFLVWGPPSHGPRSKVFARELGITNLHFIYGTRRRGWWAAPFKYSYQAFQTLLLLFRQRPRLVFVQSPPSFAVLFVYLYCALTGSHYLVDTHSDALQSRYWTRPRFLYRFLARRAAATIVTNTHFQAQFAQWGARAIVIHNIPSQFAAEPVAPLPAPFNLVVVNSFAYDEPLAAVLAAASALPDVQFHITGNKRRAHPDLLTHAPPNVHFTDYLPDPAYYGLLQASQGVMCLTTRDHTMQRGACEALSLGRPIITSHWPLLRAYFSQGTLHVDNSPEALIAAVRELRRNYPTYLAQITTLRDAKQQEWENNVAQLAHLVRELYLTR